MAVKKTIDRAHEDDQEGKAPSTQAGEFVHEEIKRVRKGEHGVRSTKQAIAIGLSKARRAGVKLPPPKKGSVSEAVRKKAVRDLEKGDEGQTQKTSTRRSSATIKALKRESQEPVSKLALSRQGRKAARKRTREERTAAAKKAARTRRHGMHSK